MKKYKIVYDTMNAYNLSAHVSAETRDEALVKFYIMFHNVTEVKRIECIE